MTPFLQKLWDFELTELKALAQRWLPAMAILVIVGYVILEVAILAPATVIGLGAYFDLKASAFSVPSSYTITQKIFPWVFPILLVINIGFRIFISLDGYFIRPRIGQNPGKFYQGILVYNPVALLTLGLHFLDPLFRRQNLHPKLA